MVRNDKSTTTIRVVPCQREHLHHSRQLPEIDNNQGKVTSSKMLKIHNTKILLILKNLVSKKFFINTSLSRYFSSNVVNAGFCNSIQHKSIFFVNNLFFLTDNS